MERTWALQEIERLVKERGPLVDCHRHIGSENTLTPELYRVISGGMHLSQKWSLMDQVRRDPRYLDTMPARVERSLYHIASQDIGFCRTYAEVDSIVGLHVLEILLEAKKRWSEKGLVLQVAAYPFGGIADPASRALAVAALERADLLGCLPSRGRKHAMDDKTSSKNTMLLFTMAHEQEKPIDLQIDQDNDPEEIESLTLVEAATEMRELGYRQPITATHCTSLGAQDPDLQKNIASRMRSLQISVIICPRANIGTKQNSSRRAPVHNSIAPFVELVAAGVTVGIGSDNVADIYEPFTTGELRDDMLMMLSAVRWTGSLETIADVMTVNGRKILGL